MYKLRTCSIIVTVLLVSIGGVLAVASSRQMDTDHIAIESMYKRRLQSFQSAPTPREMAEAYVKDLTDNAVWMPQNAPPVRGRAAIQAWAEKFFGQYILEIDNQEMEPLEVGGNLAIRRWVSAGVYVERESSLRIPFDQKYIDILAKQADGSWKLTSHMWSSNNKEVSIWR